MGTKQLDVLLRVAAVSAICVGCLAAPPAGAWHTRDPNWGSFQTNVVRDPTCDGTADWLCDAHAGFTRAKVRVYQDGWPGTHYFFTYHYAKAFAQCRGQLVIVADEGEYSTDADVTVTGSEYYNLTYSDGGDRYCKGKAHLIVANPNQQAQEKELAWTHDQAGTNLPNGSYFHFGWEKNSLITVYDGCVAQIYYRSEGSGKTCLPLPGQPPPACEDVTADEKVTGTLPEVDFR